MSILTMLCFVAAAIILYRVLHHIAHLNYKEWADRKLEFTLLALAYSLTCAGSLATAFGWKIGATMLLIGFAAIQIIDRRNKPR